MTNWLTVFLESVEQYRNLASLAHVPTCQFPGSSAKNKWPSAFAVEYRRAVTETPLCPDSIVRSRPICAATSESGISMVVNSAGNAVRVANRNVGACSLHPYTGEYQSCDISFLQLQLAVNNRARGARSSLTNRVPPGMSCREPGAKCQEASSACNPIPSRTSRMTQKRDF